MVRKNTEIINKCRLIANLRVEIARQNNQIVRQNNEIINLRAEIAWQNDEIIDLRAENVRQNTEIADLRGDIGRLWDAISQMNPNGQSPQWRPPTPAAEPVAKIIHMVF